MRNILLTRVLRKRKCIIDLSACASLHAKTKSHETRRPFLLRHKPRQQAEERNPYPNDRFQIEGTVLIIA